MTRQELTAQLAGLQQKRLILAAKLDKETLQLQLWDRHISLLQEMLVTLQKRDEQEERFVKMVAEEVQVVTIARTLPSIETTKSLGA